MLAELHHRQEAWTEAIKALEKVLGRSNNKEVRCDAYLKLAEIWDEHQGRLDKARECVRSVLDLDDGHATALYKWASFELREGRHEEAAATTRKLVDQAKSNDERALALVSLAEIERARDNDKGADEALRNAIALQGNGGPAAATLRDLAQKSGSWVSYAAALAAFLANVSSKKVPRPEDNDLAQAYLELAEAYESG